MIIVLHRASHVKCVRGAAGNRTPISALQTQRLPVRQTAPCTPQFRLHGSRGQPCHRAVFVQHTVRYCVSENDSAAHAALPLVPGFSLTGGGGRIFTNNLRHRGRRSRS